MKPINLRKAIKKGKLSDFDKWAIAQLVTDGSKAMTAREEFNLDKEAEMIIEELSDMNSGDKGWARDKSILVDFGRRCMDEAYERSAGIAAAHETEVELRPCPFCGMDFNGTLRFSSNAQGMEHNCRTQFRITSPLNGSREWNNAYCWKELASRDAIIKKLAKYGKHLDGCKSIPIDNCRSLVGRNQKREDPSGVIYSCSCGLTETLSLIEKNEENKK